MIRIDAHLHVFARRSDTFPRDATDLAAGQTRGDGGEASRAHARTRDRPGDAGADRWWAIAEHAYLQHCLATYPHRFLGIGLVPADSAEPEAHMNELAEQVGIVGFRLDSLGEPADPFAPIDVHEFASYRIWRYVAERDYVL